MDRMIFGERARSVEVLVSGLSLRQQLLTLSQCLSRFQYFMISYPAGTERGFNVESMLNNSCNVDQL
jgi:hypothetical protein